MIWLANPLWLSGLLAGPLIWWLHRAAGHGRPVLVSSLLLFRDSQPLGSAGTPVRRTDPAWRRRALAACLLALALTEPSIALRARAVTVWLDDSLSMMTREASGTRLALAQMQLRELLASERLTSMEIRSLTNPALTYPLGAAPPSGNELALRLPAPAALRLDRAHWLVSDDTSTELARWVSSAPIKRVIKVGTATENVAITALAARADLADPARYEVEVTLYNAGRGAASRTLTLWTGRERIAQQRLELAAGTTRTVALASPLPVAAWVARLEPQDALSADDSIELPVEALRPRRVQLDNRCAPALRIALASHPSLRIVTADAAADLSVICGDAPAATPRPTLVVRSGGPAERGTSASAAAWSAEAQRMLTSGALPSAVYGRGALTPDSPDSQVLLQSTAGPLVTRQGPAPFRVETTLDLGAPSMSAQPEYPLLVAALLDLTLGHSTLYPLARSERDPRASVIAATTAARPRPAADGAPGQRVLHLAALLIAIAALLLLWDLLLALRERARA